MDHDPVRRRHGGFVPVGFAVWFDALPVFLLTSLAAMALDGVFVLLQRYNRSRLARLYARQSGKEKK